VGAGAITDAIVSAQGLYPAEHRALRELHAMTRQLAAHWGRLAQRLGGEPSLEAGVAAAHELLSELADRTAAYGLHGSPAAQGTGRGLAGMRGVGDLMLERNQVMRGAVLDAEHVTTLLAYLAALAARRDDAALADWHRSWETRMRACEDAVRAAAVALAEDPEAAVAPAEPGKLGRAGHSLANGLGTLGEAFDASALGRRFRR
jgi:hypothetical protein